jgi:RNA polymerase sigma factor (TIGR02999 family)
MCSEANTGRERPLGAAGDTAVGAGDGDVPPGEVTRLLQAWTRGDAAALDQLLPRVQTELRRLARRKMRGERSGHTLQTTALVNEAYLRLIDVKRVVWQDRAHFFAVVARLMRRILIDYARNRGSLKRGGGLSTVELCDPTVSPVTDPDLLALDEALEALAAVDARKSQVVELRFFGGLSVRETAQVLKVSTDTVARDWRLAKVWLLRELRSDARHRTRPLNP